MTIPPRIGITLGDPGGIGPEVAAAVLAGAGLPDASYIVFGSRAIFDEALRTRGLPPDSVSAGGVGPAARPDVEFRDPGPAEGSARRGGPDADNGRASFVWFREAVEAARRGEIRALVSGPVSKKAWELAGVRYRGHTEYLESLHPGAIMSFWSETLTVALLSHHLPLREALAAVTRANLASFLRRLDAALARWRPGRRELLVAGLNPHAGEAGLLGREEAETIGPAVEEARRYGVAASGPYPPDVVFRMARGRPDAVAVALYHDQGLIAFKMESFETGVNATLGLPFIRTSPDHGTAFDIAGRGIADPRSMAAAVRLAADLSSSVL